MASKATAMPCSKVREIDAKVRAIDSKVGAIDSSVVVVLSVLSHQVVHACS
jgi:hypothetical protein